MKDFFYTTMRYIFFAMTLMSDCVILILSDVLLLLFHFHFTIQMSFCLIVYVTVSLYTFITPLTLTVMTLERFVAICMPLRHGELCSTRSALHCILIIHAISALPDVIFLSIFFASVNHSFYTQSVFFMKDFFYTTMRYIFFALTLISDCVILILSDFLLILAYFQITIHVSLCLIVYVALSLYAFVTPLTLTVMTLERFVAICMPLRHGELCSTRSTLHCILIIHGISALPCVVFLSIFFAFASHSYYTQSSECAVQKFTLYTWHGHFRSAISQFYFLIMVIIIMFSYFKIMKVARAASGQNRKSTWKGLRTVVLHGFQLFLCLLQLWCPFIEAAVLQINLVLYINVSSWGSRRRGDLKQNNTVFSMKDFFYSTMRYIFFALTLMSDCVILILSDFLLILAYFHFTIHVSLCLIVYVALSLYAFVTPVTLTVMTLERFVAICMPLRHGELCSTRSALHCILIIHGISALPCVVFLSIFFAFASHSYYTQSGECAAQKFVLYTWQGHLRSAISQFYFLTMVIVIMFSYFKIMKVARAASGQNRKSTWKGLRTVVLHGFQLFLCLLQLWCPFIEAAVLQINLVLYINVSFKGSVHVHVLVKQPPLNPLVCGRPQDPVLSDGLLDAACGAWRFWMLWIDFKSCFSSVSQETALGTASTRCSTC
ncbi:odorant receptor 131-2-like [Solea senegalensis]|uniref:Odorant receptor 131-2-like n=1 Tax=Solea senegalensis TaxID=28829 RepID=A0AAV6PCM1_SOLSE|nr:odorant receptor 131-2-like [Solea senegalensis]